MQSLRKHTPMLAALLFAHTAVHAQIRDPEAAPTEPVLIKKIQANGSGCPIGSVATNIGDDKKSFTLTFSDFVAETGPNMPYSAARKNCTLTMVLDVPAGWQYSIASYYYRGFMQLDSGIKAEHSVDYYFEGQGLTNRFGTTQSGPYAADYVFNDDVGLASSVYSPCQESRALNINAKIRIYNSNPSGFPNSRGVIANDSVDGQIRQVWGLTWKRCS